MELCHIESESDHPDINKNSSQGSEDKHTAKDQRINTSAVKKQITSVTCCRMGSLPGILFSLWLISGIRAQEISHEATVIDMMPNTFDDQYIGCEDKMERKVLKILEEELKYNQFAVMWEEASKAWNGKGLGVRSKLKDNYGIAVVLYTMEEPYPIYRQLNGNVSIAGISRDFYMKNFHFKALHFYLTRALQVLRTGCAEKSQVYRGTEIGNVDVAEEMRFGRFTSTSKYRTTAEGFGRNPFFDISTCYGVDIADLSDYEEQEYIIPVAETFVTMSQTGTTYELDSTGKLCSFFNCAYLGGKQLIGILPSWTELQINPSEKIDSPVCTSDPAGFPNSGPGTHFIITRLIVILILQFVIFS